MNKDCTMLHWYGVRAMMGEYTIYLRKNQEEIPDERKDMENGIRCHSLLDE